MNDYDKALRGDHETAKRLTEAGVLVPCQRLGLDHYIKDSLRKKMEAQP